MNSWLHILDDKPLIHRADCSDPQALGREADAPDGNLLAPVLRDEVIAYGLAVRPAYEGLRSLFGQYAGLLLLAYGSPRADYPDLEVMAVATQQLRQTDELLRATRPPAGATEHHRHLLEAESQLKQVHQDLMNGLRRGEQKEKAHRRLKIAQASLHKASDTRFAMTLVDLGSSCCSCAAASPSAEAPQAGTERR